MKMRFFALMSLALVACLAPTLVAQDEQGGRRRGQGGPGGRFGGPGGPGGPGRFEMPATLELMSLLRMEEVRKEIGLEDEIWEAVQENTQMDFRSMFQMSEDERKKKLEELDEAAQGVMEEVFQPNQQKRLMGLFAQNRGVRAINNELISKEIELSDSAKKKIDSSMEQINEEMSEERRKMFEGMGFGRGRGQGGDAGGERPNFEEMREKMTKLTEDANKKMEDAFKKADAAAYKRFEELKGKEFDFPEMRGFGRGGPGGPGGPGGGRPRGGRTRPGSDNN